MRDVAIMHVHNECQIPINDNKYLFLGEAETTCRTVNQAGSDQLDNASGETSWKGTEMTHPGKEDFPGYQRQLSTGGVDHGCPGVVGVGGSQPSNTAASFQSRRSNVISLIDEMLRKPVHCVETQCHVSTADKVSVCKGGATNLKVGGQCIGR